MKVLTMLEQVHVSMDALREKLVCTSVERVELSEIIGRVTAQPLIANRDSPAADVSAMDGYAIRIAEAQFESLPVVGVAKAGYPPACLPQRAAIRIFTGGVVPDGADCIIKREDCDESSRDSVRFPPGLSVRSGANIRKRGENVQKGQTVLPLGELVTPSKLAGIVTFCEEPRFDVYRRVRVSVINTGDELMPPGESLEEWQIRDSNGPWLTSSLGQHPWMEVESLRVSDSLSAIQNAIETCLKRSDAIILTGGVSMGDTDYVPDAIRNVGGQVVFHRIPIRPGKPLLGAHTPDGKLILGLPGNPMSVAVTFRRFGLGLLRKVAGFNGLRMDWDEGTLVPVHCEDSSTLGMLWYRTAVRRSDGSVTVESTKGSGDIAGLSRCDGFVEVPPGETTAGLRKWFAW